jgi:hypothetical protein
MTAPQTAWPPLCILVEYDRKLATGPSVSPKTPDREKGGADSLRHGIFSKVVAVKSESRAEFDSVLNGPLVDFDSVGTLEGILVEKLAI